MGFFEINSAKNTIRNTIIRWILYPFFLIGGRALFRLCPVIFIIGDFMDLDQSYDDYIKECYEINAYSPDAQEKFRNELDFEELLWKVKYQAGLTFSDRAASRFAMQLDRIVRTAQRQIRD